MTRETMRGLVSAPQTSIWSPFVGRSPAGFGVGLVLTHRGEATLGTDRSVGSAAAAVEPTGP